MRRWKSFRKGKKEVGRKMEKFLKSISLRRGGRRRGKPSFDADEVRRKKKKRGEEECFQEGRGEFNG